MTNTTKRLYLSLIKNNQNMRNFFYIFGLLLLSVATRSQNIGNIIPPSLKEYTVLDSAKYIFAYELTFVADTTKMDKTEKNQLLLQIGDKVSKFAGSDFFLGRELQKKTAKPNGIPLIDGKGVAATEVYKNLAQHKETIMAHFTMLKEVFYYEESFPDFKWIVFPDTKTILGHPCMKAITHFLGRNYEAWFTMDIPMNNGPWKFGGLPGMILQVTDDKGHYNFVCTGIKELTETEPIIKSDAVYEKKSRKDINKLYKLQHENINMFGEAMGQKVRTVGNVSSFSYNPIEQE